MKRNLSTKGQLLARRRGALFGASLWLKDDHVLSVRNMRFTEEYARYYYKDILAIQVRRAPRFSCPIGLICSVAVLGCLALVFYKLPPHGIAALSAIALLALAGYNTYITLFRSCWCHIITAIGTDQLPSLFRLRATRKAIALIAERVLAAQEAVDAKESELNPNTAPGSFANRSRPTSLPAVSAATEQSLNNGIRKGQFAAFLTIFGTLADAVITLLQSRRVPIDALGWIGGVNLLLVLGGAIAAVMLFRDSKQFRWLRNVALVSALFVAGISSTSAQINRTWQALRKTNPGGLNAFNSAVTEINIAGDFCLVLAGAVLTLRRRFVSPREPEPAVPGAS